MLLHQPQLALDGDTDLVIRRRFPHSPAKVWRALTEPPSSAPDLARSPILAAAPPPSPPA